MPTVNWKPEEPAELSVLGSEETARSSPQTVHILEVSGKRVHLAAAAIVGCGTAVRLEWGGQLVLGEVIESGPGGFWMEIHHMLLDTASLNWQKQGWHRG